MRKIEYSKKTISNIRIGVDARPFSTSVSGVGKMIHSALLDLGKNSNFEFYLFSHKDLHPSYSNLLNLPGIRFIKGEGFFSKKRRVLLCYCPSTSASKNQTRPILGNSAGVASFSFQKDRNCFNI